MELIVLESEAFHALVQEVLHRLKAKEPEKGDKWVGKKEAMRKLRIKSSGTLQHYRDTGVIRFSQPAKKIILYDAESIDEFLEKNARARF